MALEAPRGERWQAPRRKALTRFHVITRFDYMKSSPAPLKTSTEHQRSYRERLRGQGLVKKDVWIRPEYAAELAAIEKSMRGQDRDPAAPVQAEAGWTIATIRQALGETAAFRDGLLTVETIEGAEPSLHLVLREHGDLSLFVAAVGEQIIASTRR